MVKRWIIALVLALPLPAVAQEVLLPLQQAPVARPSAPKEPAAAVRLPFFDDFADGSLDATLWQPVGGAVATLVVSPLAPTVGVATLDALDAEGNLYPQASTSLFPADTLVSMPLRLDSLTAADSVVFSFFYLPGGGYGNLWERVGDTPDPQDSLFLDFYSPQDSVWVTVWSRGGISVDTLLAATGTAWQYVMLPMADARWFDSAFCFRFRNYASLESSTKPGKSGNGDFWHLDYVTIDRGRDTAAGPVFRDVAFAAPAPTMLRLYRAMPYRHYRAADMASSLSVTITNLFSSALATQYAYIVSDSLGNELYRYDGGFENAPSYWLTEGYQTAPMHASPTVAYAFPSMTAPADYTVMHIVREGTAGDGHPQNDTVRYCQHFGDSYAYDDGVPENGYGLTSTASQLYLAYRFDLAVEDTLTAVDVFFNRALDDGNAAVPFYLTLWSVADDGRPYEVLYRDSERRFPLFGGFQRYVLEVPTVCSGSVFVGLEQTGSDYINIGFDRSLNTSDRIWYLTGTEWQQSILSGSLMLRPCFGSAATVGMPQADVSSMHPTVYPNPASDVLHIEGVPDGSVVQLFDAQGRRLATTTSHRLATIALPSGLYLLRIVAPDGMVASSRVIIKH